MQIAVLEDEQGHVSAFERGGVIRLYEKQENGWAKLRELPYQTHGIDQPSAFRSQLDAVCAWLLPCTILAAQRFRGTYRVVFERHTVSMWEMEGFQGMAAENFLNDIASYHAQPVLCAAQGLKEDEVIKPAQWKDGYYSIDLTEVMKHRTSVNSQQILLAFFKETAFYELRIQCEHIPKWFERELPKYGLTMESQPNGTGLLVTVTLKKS